MNNEHHSFLDHCVLGHFESEQSLPSQLRLSTEDGNNCDSTSNDQDGVDNQNDLHAPRDNHLSGSDMERYHASVPHISPEEYESILDKPLDLCSPTEIAQLFLRLPKFQTDPSICEVIEVTNLNRASILEHGTPDPDRDSGKQTRAEIIRAERERIRKCGPSHHKWHPVYDDQ